MFLQNIKIRTKLIFTYAFLIILLIVSIGFSLLSLSRATNNIQAIVTEAYPMTVKANLLIDNFQTYVEAQQLMLLDVDKRWATKTDKTATKATNRITQLFKELDNKLEDDDSRKAMVSLEEIREQYNASRYRIVDAMQKNDREGAIDELVDTTITL